MPIAFSLLAAAAASAQAPTPLRTHVLRVDCVAADCATPRRSRYRLDPQVSDDADGKARALAENGRPCATSARVCTRRPRTIFAAPID